MVISYKKLWKLLIDRDMKNVGLSMICYTVLQKIIESSLG